MGESKVEVKSGVKRIKIGPFFGGESWGATLEGENGKVIDEVELDAEDVMFHWASRIRITDLTNYPSVHSIEVEFDKPHTCIIVKEHGMGRALMCYEERKEK